jgi:hypothetical protein
MIEKSCTNRIWMGNGFFQQAMFHETRGVCRVCPSYGFFYQPNGHAQWTTPGKSLFLEGSSVTNLGPKFIEVHPEEPGSLGIGVILSMRG